MKLYKVKIKSAITEWVCYFDKIGETYTGELHHTDSMFWFPGTVYKTPNGYIYEQDADVIEEYESPVSPVQNN